MMDIPLTRTSTRAQLDANFVRDCLNERGWTQRELAERCNVELRTLQRWLSGSRVDVGAAERIAKALERGMGSVCAALPQNYARSPLARFTSGSPLLDWLERHDAPLATSFRLLAARWHPWVSLLHFHGQPLERYVTRVDSEPFEHTFLPLRIHARSPATLRFGAQVSPRVRFSFGEVRVDGRNVRLEEYAFTRALDGARRPSGEFVVLVWISPDVRELVISSDAAHSVERFRRDASDPTIFDADAEDLKGAVCFRPSAMDLRVAGLPPWDDRYRPRSP